MRKKRKRTKGARNMVDSSCWLKRTDTKKMYIEVILLLSPPFVLPVDYILLEYNMPNGKPATSPPLLSIDPSPTTC